MENDSLEDVLSKQSILVSAPSSSAMEERVYRYVYNSVMSSEIENVIWVCYQHTANVVEKKLESYDMDYPSVHFIDMISHMMGLKEDREDVLYCKSPTDYNQLFRSVDRILDENEKCLVIVDNLNAMLSYDLLERVIKTLRSLNNRMPQKDSTILYLEITGAFANQTEVTIEATMNHVLHIDEEQKDYGEWENLKKISWRDVFSLNAPIMFAMLMVMLFLLMLYISILTIVLVKTW